MSKNLQSQLSFYKITEKDTEALKKASPVVEGAYDQLLTEFYEHILEYQHLAEKFSGDIEGVKEKQKNHWRTLFEGSFDNDYEKKVKHIGAVHHKVQLDPTWYIGGYAFAICGLIDLLVDKHKLSPGTLKTTLKSFVKASMLDMDLALSSYATSNSEGEMRQRFCDLTKAVKQAFEYSSTEMAESSEKLDQVSQQVSEAVKTVQERSVSNVSAAENNKMIIDSTVDTSRELHAAIKEISSQVTRSSSITSEAVDQTQIAQSKIDELVNCATTIGDVIQMINKIASQTNLLALNATIEAARAGDAGKGFAVVASEVKNLANQTESATEEITNQVTVIQNTINDTVQLFHSVGTTVTEMNEIASIISGAVEEQNAATSSIADNIEKVADQSTQSKDRAEEVKNLAAETEQTAVEITNVASDVKDTFNSLLKTLGAIVEDNHGVERRKSDRFDVNLKATVDLDGAKQDLEIVSLSQSGFSMKYVKGFNLDGDYKFTIDGLGSVSGKVVRFAGDEFIACEAKFNGTQTGKINEMQPKGSRQNAA